MPVIAVVIGFVGSAIGTAIGAAIGGTILGVSAATIGGIIGAGIAGGALAAINGGSFGKGFLMGAAGGAIGSFLQGGLGNAMSSGDFSGGATQFADGTTVEGMLAGQGGADFAPSALEGISPMGEAGASTFGMGDFSPPTGTALPDASGSGNFDLSTMGDSSSNYGQTSTPTQPGGFTLDQLGQNTANTNLGFNAGNSSTSPLGDTSYSLTSGSTPGTSNGLQNIVSDYAGSTPSTPVEGITSPSNASGGTSTPTGSLNAPNNPLGGNSTPQTQTSPSSGIGKMMSTSDQWLKNNMGATASNPTSKLLLGGADALMKMYQTHKLESVANGTKPLSFEEFQAKYSDPNAYKTAANRMGKAGHTGTLPVLLARMKNTARGQYANYLPNAQQTYLNNKANISQGYTGALQNLFSPMYAGAQ